MGELAYVKIALYKNEAIPMHYHWPYEYWQFPWEKHRSNPGLHDNITNESWIFPDNTPNGRINYSPTDEEVEWYRACLIRKTPGPLTPEQAYNMMKIMGKLEAVKDASDILYRVAKHRNAYYGGISSLLLRNDIQTASTIILAVQHVRSKH
jgi:hypothetical protein